jgi:exonuclease SbcC
VADLINNGKQFIKVSQANLQDYQQRIQQLSEKIQEARKELPDIDLLMEIQTWHNRWLASEKEAEQLKARQADIADQKSLLEKEKKELLAQSQLEPAQHRLEIDKLVAILQASEQQLKAQLQQEEKQFQELGLQKGIADFAESLKAGEPCPLCGSVHHPGGHDLEQVDQQWQAIQQQIEERQAEIARVGSLLVQLPVLGRQLARLQQTEDELSQQQEQLEDSRQALRAEFPAEDSGFSDLAQLPENLARFKQQKGAIAEQEKQWELLTKSQSKEVNKLDKYQKGLADLQETYQQYEVEIQTSLRGLRHLNFDSYQGFHDESLLKEADKTRREYQELSELFEQTEKHHSQLQSRRDSLQGELESLEKQAQGLTQKLAGTVKTLHEALASSDFERVEEVEEILATALNPAAERNALNRYEQQLQQAVSDLQASESRLAGKAYKPEVHQQLESEIQELQQQLSELNQKRGGLQQEKERLQAQLERKKTIQQELEKLRLRAENLNTLRKLFSRSGFVNYVSGIFLQNLCLAANARFQKLSRNALSLEVAADNHFVVRDYLNDGQARSVKTLSGGQTFQASLSLALALADQVQQQVQARQNFFFIDEGFGSQDKESLQVIFETLKSLRRENRIVGIISHVEELQQEIDTFLHIHNPDEQGSKIHGSWEE